MLVVAEAKSHRADSGESYLAAPDEPRSLSSHTGQFFMKQGKESGILHMIGLPKIK